MSSSEDIKWFTGKFSWYTAALAGGFGVFATLASLRIRHSSQVLENLLQSLAPDSSKVDDIASKCGWALLCTFVLAGVVFAGSVFNIWCKLFMACRREKFANGQQDCCTNSCCCFSLLSISRFTMNVVHAFCILATLWFAVLMSAQAVLVFIFWHTEQLAEGSHLVESTGEAAQSFTSDTAAWLEKREEELSGVVFNMSGYCSRVQCGTTIVSAMDTLETLRNDTSSISTALGDGESGVCPAVGCLNLNFIWFMKNSTCLCDQDGIEAVRGEAVEGGDSASASLYFIAVTLVLLTLLISKMSANLKSLTKDDHWMQRVELVLDRLGRAGGQGLQVQDSLVEIMQDASMSNFVWAQHGQAAAAGNQTFGLAGGYGGGFGAKAAIAPPRSGANNAHDTIAAGNTIDGAHRGMVRPAEAHL